MVAIIVTGTPGTGKTSVAKALAKKMRYKYIDVNKVIKSKNLVEGYDKERKTNIVDEEKLSKALVELIKHSKNIIIDSHLSHYIPAKYADFCIVTKCELGELKRRLKKKKYHNAKIRENLDAEIFDICLTEASEAGHNVIIADTTKKTAAKIANELFDILKHP